MGTGKIEIGLGAREITLAYERIKDVVRKTPLEYSKRLSIKYGAEIYLKREDLQEVRSYKIRGAFNFIFSLTQEERHRGVVCASAGNHAQGFAYSCNLLKIRGIVIMPEITPRQKNQRVKLFGDGFVDIELIGTTFDESSAAATEFCEKNNMVFVHPFDDLRTIAGQGTVGLEIYSDLPEVDFILAPIGGGGLVSGISLYFQEKNSKTKLIGVDPAGAPKMATALKTGYPVTLEKIDTFIDGAAVKRAGNLTYEIISANLEKVLVSEEGKVCTTMIELYQNEGIVAEPAGALALSALDQVKEEIKGKKVVCILSGGNNDILRYPEIMERSLIYEGLKHYFIVEFAQKPGQLRTFVEKALSKNEDIVRFEYIKKNQ